MKTKLLLFVFVLCYTNLITTAQTPQYYNYNTSGTANSFPFNVSAGKQAQFLYLPGDFNQPTPAPVGYISSISIRINDAYPLGPWTYTEFTIKMGQSTITDFGTGNFYTGSLSTVYYRASVTLTGTAGDWMTIELDNPFYYNPAQSLIVDISQCSAPGATGYSMSTTPLSGNRRIYSVGGCPFAYQGTAASVCNLGLTFATAQPGITLISQAACNNNSGVAYNPLKNLYYGVRAGGTTLALETWSSTGVPLNNTTAGFDWRGMWWNPLLSQLEGNGTGASGIWNANLDANGYALNTGVLVFSGMIQPEASSCGDFDYTTNEMIHYYNGSIYRYSRSAGTLLGSYAITGTPVALSNLNNNTVMFTGHTGKEIALLDYVNKRVYFYNKATGAYTGMSQLPGTAVTTGSYRTSWAHDYLWIFDTPNCTWNSYKVIDTVPGNYCTNATPITCGQTVTGTTINGTSADAPLQCSSITTLNTSPGVWYTFTGDGSSVNVNTCGAATNYDTKIGIFSGSCASLTCVDADDDGCGYPKSSVSFCTLPGVQYYIYVTGYSNYEGVFELEVSCESPVIINIPANITQSIDPGECGAAVTVPLPVDGVDYINAVGFTNDFNGTSDASGYYPVGTTIVKWTATGICSAIDTCSQTITIVDNDFPVIECPSDTILYSPSGTGLAFPYLVTADDNCSISGLNLTAGLASGAVFPLGLTTNTWVATDPGGNSSTCSFSVTVISTFGLDETDGKHVLLYPNPTNGILTIELPEDYSGTRICLYSAKGKLIRIITESTHDGFIECDLSDIAEGLYFLKFENNSSVFFKKVIKN